jgi:hypothetical protein
VAWVAAAAWPIATPLAGTAEAPETANSPTAAEVAAAKASILSVIALSIRTLVEPGDERSRPQAGIRWLTSPRRQ